MCHATENKTHVCTNLFLDPKWFQRQCYFVLKTHIGRTTNLHPTRETFTQQILNTLGSMLSHTQSFEHAQNIFETPCMEKMWNLGISFPGNIAFGGKSLQL